MNRNVALTLGDLKGINAFILYRALKDLTPNALQNISLVGEKKLLFAALEKTDVFPEAKSLFAVPTWYQPAAIFSNHDKLFSNDPADLNYQGEVQLRSLVCSTELIQANICSAIVNCPVNKEAIASVRPRFRGQTEFYQSFDKKPYVVMCFYGTQFHCALMTTHIPLSRVEKSITKSLLLEKIKIVCHSFPNETIYVCGVNPHNGDNGLFGTIDQTVTKPTVQSFIAQGYPISGPYPADALFYKISKIKEKPPVVISMYHDQGTIPFKLYHFDSGVNTTLGLSFHRCSTDHGPAYDIAYRGTASHLSLLAAIKQALDPASINVDPAR